MPPDQLPAIVQPTALTNRTDTYIVPALVTAVGDQASWRYVEFFTANIRNPHTRRAYARGCSRFFAWCELRGLSLACIRPFDVAAWIEAGIGGCMQHTTIGGDTAAVERAGDFLALSRGKRNGSRVSSAMAGEAVSDTAVIGYDTHC